MNNALCSNCGQQADTFCTCWSTVSLLCGNCLGKHQSKTPGSHSFKSLEHHYALLQDLGIDEFTKRERRVEAGSALVKKLEDLELQQYHQLRTDIQQTTEMYLQWVDYMHTAFTQIIMNFNQEKLSPMTTYQPVLSSFAYFIFGLGEVGVGEVKLVESAVCEMLKTEIETLQRTLYSQAGPTNDYQTYFIEKIQAPMRVSMEGYYTQVSAPVQYPQYTMPSPYAQPVSSPPMQPMSAQMQPFMPPPIPIAQARYHLQPKSFETYLPFSRGYMMGKWDTRSEKLTTMRLPKRLNISKNVISVILPNGDMCFVGGRRDHAKRAVVVDGSNAAITDLRDMNEGRANAGLVFLNRRLYVFGGYEENDANLNTGEKYSFDQGTWDLFSARMRDGRYQFNPAVYQQLIYLAGGCECNSVETFNVGTETFQTLPLTLPKQSGTLALVHNNELLILQETVLVRWRLGANSATQQHLNMTVVESNTVPQTYGNKVFFNNETDDQCQIYVFDLNSMTVTMVDGLKNSGGPRNPDCPVS